MPYGQPETHFRSYQIASVEVEVGAAVGNSSGRDIGSGGGSETANERGMSGESWCRSTLKDP